MWFGWSNTEVVWTCLHLCLALWSDYLRQILKADQNQAKDPHATQSWCQTSECSLVVCLQLYTKVKLCYVSFTLIDWQFCFSLHHTKDVASCHLWVLEVFEQVLIGELVMCERWRWRGGVCQCVRVWMWIRVCLCEKLTPSSPPFTLLICEARKMEREHSFWKKCYKLLHLHTYAHILIKSLGPIRFFIII